MAPLRVAFLSRRDCSQASDIGVSSAQRRALMKKFSFVLFLAMVLTGASTVIAQTQSSGSVPCVDEPTVGRPVLKLIKRTPDDQPSEQPPHSELSKSQPCDNSVAEASTTPS